jgi:cell division protein ZapA
MKRPIEVEIFGQRYSVSGEGDQAYVKELAQHVDERMREIASTAGNIPPTKLALLAAINITHEFFKIQKQQKQKESIMDKKARDLIHAIDQQVGDLIKAPKHQKHKEPVIDRKNQDLIDTIDQQFGDLKLY